MPISEPGRPVDGAFARGGRLSHRTGLVGRVFVTFQLLDALPLDAAIEIAERAIDDGDSLERARRVERALDVGHGACLLRDPDHAELVTSALTYFDGARYDLLTWVVMPNHVHVAMATKPGFGLDRIVHSWKWFTASRINRRLQRSGALWRREYFDRRIVDDDMQTRVVDYIEANPVKAGLCPSILDWQWSGVHRRLGREPTMGAHRPDAGAQAPRSGACDA
jgi:REP element-mobilizing transposase RayT